MKLKNSKVRKALQKMMNEQNKNLNCPVRHDKVR